jgi:cysteine desulfurase / selenocysteine lyase
MESELLQAKTYDVSRVRADFPILNREVRPGIPLVYLDSTATSQKPAAVIETMDQFYRRSNANIHRGIHTLAEESTQLYETARVKIGKFINAPSARQILFTRSTTESINLVAQTWGRTNLNSGDVVILTEMEHHSNLVPWQMLAVERGLRLEFIPVTPDGLLDLDVYQQLLELEPRLVAFTHMSNVLGTINPAAEIIRLAHAAGAVALVDGAQSLPHLPVDVQALDADFVAFSAHKMCGPTGIGVLYGRKNLLESMPPYQGGGDMIKRVHLRSFTPNEIPYKFEAGTPAIAEAVGLGAAVDYLTALGMENVHQHEQFVTNYAFEALSEVEGLRHIGPPASQKGGLATFTLEGIHPHDLAQLVDEDGIAIRAGHHCAMPLHRKLGISASARASFYVHTTTGEIDLLVESLERARRIFRL